MFCYGNLAAAAQAYHVINLYAELWSFSEVRICSQERLELRGLIFQLVVLWQCHLYIVLSWKRCISALKQGNIWDNILLGKMKRAYPGWFLWHIICNLGMEPLSDEITIATRETTMSPCFHQSPLEGLACIGTCIQGLCSLSPCQNWLRCNFFGSYGVQDFLGQLLFLYWNLPTFLHAKNLKNAQNIIIARFK